jgi:hypothetical protein
MRRTIGAPQRFRLTWTCDAMKPKSRRILYGLCALLGIPAVPAHPCLAQGATPPPTMTIEAAKDFLTAAGLQTCEVSEIDPMVSQFNGALASLSLGVAKDCSSYDPDDPTVVNVHQFADQEARDGMVASLKNLRYRALRAYGDVWAVDNFVVVLLGPRRQEVEAMLKAEYLRRHPDAS